MTNQFDIWIIVFAAIGALIGVFIGNIFANEIIRIRKEYRKRQILLIKEKIGCFFLYADDSPYCGNARRYTNRFHRLFGRTCLLLKGKNCNYKRRRCDYRGEGKCQNIVE